MILMPQIFDVTANEIARYKRNELELHFVNSLLSANFLIGKQQNDTNIRWQK